MRAFEFGQKKAAAEAGGEIKHLSAGRTPLPAWHVPALSCFHRGTGPWFGQTHDVPCPRTTWILLHPPRHLHKITLIIPNRFPKIPLEQQLQLL